MIILKALFKNITIYDTNTYDEFLKFHRNKFHIPYTFFTAIGVIILFYIISMQVIYHAITVAIIFCIILTAFFLWRYLHPISEVKKDYNSDTIQNKEKFTFLFFDKTFRVKNKLISNSIKYYDLYKVFETDNYFYLCVDKSHSFLVSKSGFANNSLNNFSDFIKKKCLLKYKKIKKI